MAYKVIITFPDETIDSEEEDGELGLFDTKEDAEAWFDQWMSDYDTGGEVLHMSNPGDYPLSDEEPEHEVVEV